MPNTACHLLARMLSRALKHGLITAVGLICLLWASELRLHSSLVEVHVLNTQYSIGFELSRDFGVTNFSTANVSSDPIGGSIASNPFTGAEVFLAEASAGLFGIHAFSPAPYDADPRLTTIRAVATSEVWFSPVTSETMTMTVHFSADGHWWDCTTGTLSLQNLTTGVELWNYQWAGTSGTVAGVPVIDLMYDAVETEIDLELDFTMASIYKLTLGTETFAGTSPRSPTITMGLSGIQPVPEPAFPAGLVLAGTWLLLRRRQQT